LFFQFLFCKFKKREKDNKLSGKEIQEKKLREKEIQEKNIIEEKRKGEINTQKRPKRRK